MQLPIYQRNSEGTTYHIKKHEEERNEKKSSLAINRRACQPDLRQL